MPQVSDAQGGHQWGHSEATLKQICIWFVKELVEIDTVGPKWCPVNRCDAQGTHEIYVQPMETVRISLAHDQTCTYCLVWGNSELLGPRSFL